MNYKQIGSLIVLIIGVLLLVFGFYIKNEIKMAKHDIESTGKLIPDNPIERHVKSEFHKEADKYNFPANLCYIGGSAFIVLGGVFFFVFRRKEE